LYHHCGWNKIYVIPATAIHNTRIATNAGPINFKPGLACLRFFGACVIPHPTPFNQNTLKILYKKLHKKTIPIAILFKKYIDRTINSNTSIHGCTYEINNEERTTMISYNKMSKKAQKEYNAQKRGSWGDVKPVTVTFSDKKKFNKADRNRQKAALRAYC
jgi:hypothetical protein